MMFFNNFRYLFIHQKHLTPLLKALISQINSSIPHTLDIDHPSPTMSMTNYRKRRSMQNCKCKQVKPNNQLISLCRGQNHQLTIDFEHNISLDVDLTVGCIRAFLHKVGDRVIRTRLPTLPIPAIVMLSRDTSRILEFQYYDSILHLRKYIAHH